MCGNPRINEQQPSLEGFHASLDYLKGSLDNLAKTPTDSMRNSEKSGLFTVLSENFWFLRLLPALDSA